ncbi:MAG: NAD(P)-dependent oxidoreductase, partial [Pseudomonadota bacterium]
AISLGRNIHGADRDFHEGRETWGLESNQGTTLLHRAPIGFIGFGDLARAFLPLIRPFGGPIVVYDPWLPDWMIEQAGCRPASLDEVLGQSTYTFVFATITTESEGLLGAREFALMPKGSNLVLVSRAAIVDFEALMDAVETGHIRAATDVLPEEPTPADHRVRGIKGFLLSAHRAGAVDEVLQRMGPMLLGDMDLMLRGLPPVGLKRAQRETVAHLRSKGVTVS